VVDRLALFTAPTVIGQDGRSWSPRLRVPRAGATMAQGRIGGDLWSLVRLGA
jgi:riboflavin biosynthesis pyrimidine reductase